jgi:hypothetical protein
MTDTKPYTDEAMALLRKTVHVYGGELIPGENEDRAAAVITAAMAEKDAKIARLRDVLKYIAFYHGAGHRVTEIALAALKPESPDHD